MQVFDGGADGLLSTTPNTLFARQGIFVPFAAQFAVRGLPPCAVMRVGPAARLARARAGLPLGAAGLLLGISFGVVAEPVMGHVAPIVMSAIVFAGAAQFAATAVLADGGAPRRRSSPASS